MKKLLALFFSMCMVLSTVALAQDTMKSPDVVKKLTESGATVVVSKSPEDFGAFQKRENDRFAKAVKEGGIETQ